MLKERWSRSLPEEGSDLAGSSWIPAQAGLPCLSCKWELETGLEVTFMSPVQNVTPVWSVSLQQRVLCILLTIVPATSREKNIGLVRYFC